MRNAVARAWSAITRIAASVSFDVPGATPLKREISRRIGWKRSVS
jgi:hypothetical protein